MKKFFTLLMTAAISLSVFSTSFASTRGAPDPDPVKALEALAVGTLSDVEWESFSDKLVVALKSSHDGLRQAAMQLVIRYGSNLDVSDGVFDVMKIYRNSPDENLRRMAVVALGNMDSAWAIQFLERSTDFEKSQIVKQTIRAVVSAHTDT